MDPVLPTKIAALLDWCRQNKIRIDPRLVLRQHPSGGIGVYASAFISNSETVVKIPKESIFSPKSCSYTDVLESFSDDGLRDDTLLLAIALFLEIRKGASSRWWGYLQSFPDHVDLPAFWFQTLSRTPDTQQAFDWLQGTELFKYVQREATSTLPAIDVLFSRLAQHVSDADLEGTSVHDLYHAFALVSSRAFQVDAYHKVGLVPIADAFNHTEENTAHLETDYHVCPHCGSLDECSHDRDDVPPKTSASDAPDESIPSLALLEPDECEMVTNAVVLPDDELYNSYDSALSNAQLMIQYGFMLEGNSNDVVEWTPAELDAIFGFERLMSTNEKAARLRLWVGLANFYLGLEERGLDNLLYDPRQVSETDAQSESEAREAGDLPLDELLEPDTPSPPRPGLRSKNNPRAKDPGSLMCISAMSQVSQQLWTYLVVHRALLSVLRSQEESGSVVDDFIVPLLTLLLLSTSEDGDDRDSSEESVALLPVLRSVSEDIVQLCQRRLSRMHCRDLPVEEIGDELEKLSASESPRSRLACMFALNERMILESCEGEWGEVRERLRLGRV